MIPLFPRCLILRVAALKQDERSLPGGVVSPIQSCFPEFDKYRQFVKRNPPLDHRQEQRLLAKIRRRLRSLLLDQLPDVAQVLLGGTDVAQTDPHGLCDRAILDQKMSPGEFRSG